MHVLHIEVIAESQNNICCYCRHLMIRQKQIYGVSLPRNAMTKDHIKPKVYGGPTTRENLIAACSQCNSLRGEMEATAFSNLMRKWFKRDVTLHARWHHISRVELGQFKEESIFVHERQLRGLARRWIEYGFRHFDFSFRERRRLKRA